MKVRQLLPAVVVSAVVSASVGFGLSQASQPETAKAGSGAKVQKQILAELKALNKGVGATYQSSSILGQLDDARLSLGKIEDSSEETCEAVSSTPYFC